MNTVALVAVVLSFIGLSCQQEQGDHAAFVAKMRSFRDACIKETGVDKDLPIKAFHDAEFPDDGKLKCYFKCVFQKMGRMDANGNIDLSAVAAHIPPNVDKAKATAALNNCKDKKGADACETAFDVAKCMREAFGAIKQDD